MRRHPDRATIPVMELCDLTVLPASAPIPADVLDAGTDPDAAAVERAVRGGGPVLVSLSGSGPGLLAAAAVYAWLGARVFRAPEGAVEELRQVLDMVASIRGDRPPALTRRGLA
jgi:hypothetical protein